MTKSIRVGVVGVCLWAMSAGIAQAAEADWWDRLSGPGPFLGVSETIRFLCISTVNGQSVATWLPPSDPGSNSIAQLVDLLKPQTFPPPPPPPPGKQNCRLDTNIRSYASVTPAWYFSYRNHLYGVRNGTQVEPGRVYLFPIIGSYTVRPFARLDLSTGFGLTIFEGEGFDTFVRPTWKAVEVRYIVKPRLFAIAASINTHLNFSNSDFCSSQTVCNPGSLSIANDNEIIPQVKLVFGL